MTVEMDGRLSVPLGDVNLQEESATGEQCSRNGTYVHPVGRNPTTLVKWPFHRSM